MAGKVLVKPFFRGWLEDNKLFINETSFASRHLSLVISSDLLLRSREKGNDENDHNFSPQRRFANNKQTFCDTVFEWGQSKAIQQVFYRRTSWRSVIGHCTSLASI